MQYVSFNGANSSITNLDGGVPKVRVLDPLLFSYYTAFVANITADFGVTIKCYADDLQL